jgi:hypothetical protein
MNSTLSPPPPGAASTMNNNSEWTLAEKIRLLELYMDKDLLWYKKQYDYLTIITFKN